MVPQVKWAQKHNMGVIMLNSNQMRDIDTDEDISSEMEGAYAHCRYVWRNVVRNLKNVEDIFMIGHSAGGS